MAGLLSLAFASYLSYRVLKENEGTRRMKSLSESVHLGAKTYLKRQYKVISFFIIAMSFILAFGKLEINTPTAFILGALLSILSGYIGMYVATKSNVRTAEACKASLSKGLEIAFSAGSVMGFVTVGLGLLGIGLLYLIYGKDVITFIAPFGLGAGSVALFARVGGGIYTKAADVGADLVGKVEKGIPEDDPRNPAVIADQVGDNVGDVAGMGADLLESYVSAIVAAMVISLTLDGLMVKGMILPLTICSIGALVSMMGSFLVRVRERGGVMEADLVRALRKGVYASLILLTLLSLPTIYFFINELFPRIFYAILSGLIAGFIIGLNSEYFTLNVYKPTRKLAEASQTGAGITIISGLALGMHSTLLPVITICLAIFISYISAGLYGVAMAGVGMLATLAITLASDAYGPIADNASGIAEMARLGSEVRRRADALDQLGNTTKATGKGFAIGSAALTTLGWVAAYLVTVEKLLKRPLALSFLDPSILAGLFIGGTVPFLFSAVAMNAVGKTAFQIVGEVRRQFREIKGLMEGEAMPDYARCVDITTRSALKEMTVPGCLAVAIPVILGFILGPGAVLSFLVSSTVVGFLLAILMANAGGAWDNAKKYIEAGSFGGKGSETHKAAVIGDTVGDPFKDTSGPSLNILIKMMSKSALVFAFLFV